MMDGFYLFSTGFNLLNFSQSLVKHSIQKNILNQAIQTKNNKDKNLMASIKSPKVKNKLPTALSLWKVPRNKMHASFSIFIYKKLKQIYPDTSISFKAISIMNSYVNYVFDRVASKASQLAVKNKRSTISSRMIRIAVRSLLPAKLAKRAVVEGDKVLNKYNSSK